MSVDERLDDQVRPDAENQPLSADSLITELEQTFSGGTDGARANTLRRITDLFVFGSGNLGDEHIELFDRIFGHLIAEIESSARAVLSTRLSTLPNAPPVTIRTLAFDEEIAVAGPVLKNSEALDNASLVENAGKMSQEHLLAISERKALSETVTDVLVERGNRDVALSAARNKGAKISEAGYMRLVKRSADDEEMAATVGAREEIPRHHFLKLLTKATHAVRSKLEAAHPQFGAEIQQAVTQVATEMQAKTAATKTHNYAAAQATVGSLHASGRLGERNVEWFARLNKFEETVVALSLMGRLPVGTVERAMVQDDAGAILILAKAIGFSWQTVKAILLLRAGSRGLPPLALEQGLVNFTKLTQATARQVIDFQRGRDSAAAPAT